MRLLTRAMKETDDDESDANRNDLMTTRMRTKRMMRMMKMMGMMRTMRMLRMLRMRMKMKMRMVIMMSRAVVGLQNLLSPASENPSMQ